MTTYFRSPSPARSARCSAALTRRARRRAWLLLLLGCWVAPAAYADQAGQDRGVRLAHEGRCEAALPDLDAARRTHASDPQLALLAGQCRIRLHRYVEATRDLAKAAELAPARGDVWLALAKAHYHAGDAKAAQQALDRAASLLPGAGDDAQRAELALYAGMLQLDRGELAEAARSLERARTLDPERVEPVASLYLGIARARAHDTKLAIAALERVSDTWRDTDWATRAQQELSRLREGAARHAWLGLGAGFEYDTNVVLRGRGVALPPEISHEDDERGVWTASGGLELWKRGDATLGAMASYRGTTQLHLDQFDAHFPSLTTWLDLGLDATTRAMARYDFGYAWLAGNPFLATHIWQVSLRRTWPRAGTSEIYARTHLDDYFFQSHDVVDAGPGGTCPLGLPTCGPAGIDERSARRRSGWGVAAGIGHSVPIAAGPLPLRDAVLHGGYEFSAFDARGRDYSYTSHEILLGFSAQLPFRLGIEANGSLAFRPYQRATTYPDRPLPTDGTPYVLSGRRRRDRELRVEARLTRALGDRVSLATSWRFVENHSTADVFDYHEHVVGIDVTVALGREL